LVFNSAAASSQRREHELLLCCARTVLRPEQVQRLSTLARQPVDWTHVLELADSHGLLPLLYTHLKAHVPDALPAAQFPLMQQRFQQNQKSAIHLAGVLVKLLELFGANGVSAVAFKGPVIAEELYGNLALRPFIDLDLILPHREIPRAAQLMLADGFVPEPGSAISLGTSAMNTAGQFAFRSSDGLALVELHSEVTLRHFPRRPDPAFFLGSPRSSSVGGRQVRTMDPASLVLSLTVHGAKDFWASLKWVVDLAEFLRVHSALDWCHVLATAEELRCQRMVHLGFLLAERLLGAQLPPELGHSCHGDRQARLLAETLAAGLLDPGGELSAGRRFAFRVRTHPRFWGGVRYALRLALTPAEEDRALSRLPGPLHSLLRPVRLVRKYQAGSRPTSGSG
jgi:hypothetical protein